MGVERCQTLHSSDQVRFRTVGVMNGVIEMPRKRASQR